MSDPWSRAASGPAPIACPSCGTENEASRRFCRRCASELRPGTVPIATEEPERRPSPFLIAGVAAMVLLAIAAVAAFALLGGGGPTGPGASPTAPSTPAASAAPTAAPSAAPTATVVPQPTPEPTPAPPTTPTIVSFDVPRRADCSDPNFPGTIRLSWEVAAAEGVTLSIDGTGVFQAYAGLTGQDDVPFACSETEHTYLLRTTGGSGPADSEEVVVRRR